jgi:site-specific recombinase XerD
MRHRPLDALETRIVEMVQEDVSASQAKRVRGLLPPLSELFVRRKVTILTALPGDLEAFCAERARTRKASSMRPLIGCVRHVFRVLCQSGLRRDNPSKDLVPPRTRARRSRRPRPSLLEIHVVEMVREKVSANEAGMARTVLPGLTEFLRRKKATLLTACTDDLQAFCEVRSRTRKPSSVTRLVAVLRTLFRVLLECGLREDNPSKALKGPRVSTKSADFAIDQRAVEQVLVKLSLVANESRGYQAFVAVRSLAILHLITAGARCLDIAALNISDAEHAVSRNGLVHLARREIVLTPSGNTILANYLALRLARAGPDCSALFVSVRTPYARLTPASVSDDIRHAIKSVGAFGCGLTPAKFHRILPSIIVNEEYGWAVAAAAIGYKQIPRTNMRYFDVAELSKLIERHHPIGRSIS